jgi:hypothetical protein
MTGTALVIRRRREARVVRPRGLDGRMTGVARPIGRRRRERGLARTLGREAGPARTIRREGGLAWAFRREPGLTTPLLRHRRALGLGGAIGRRRPAAAFGECGRTVAVRWPVPEVGPVERLGWTGLGPLEQLRIGHPRRHRAAGVVRTIESARAVSIRADGTLERPRPRARLAPVEPFRPLELIRTVALGPTVAAGLVGAGVAAEVRTLERAVVGAVEEARPLLLRARRIAGRRLDPVGPAVALAPLGAARSRGRRRRSG